MLSYLSNLPREALAEEIAEKETEETEEKVGDHLRVTNASTATEQAIGLHHAQSQTNAPAGTAKRLMTAALAHVSSAAKRVTNNVIARVEEAAAEVTATIHAEDNDEEAAETDVVVVQDVTITVAPTARAQPATTAVRERPTAVTADAAETTGIANVNGAPVEAIPGDRSAGAQPPVKSFQTSHAAPARKGSAKSRGHHRPKLTPTNARHAKTATTPDRALTSTATVTTSTVKTPEMCLTQRKDHSTKTSSEDPNSKS